MANYWTDWYAGWGWLLWFGMIVVIFSSTGNWGYTYSAHRRYRDLTGGKDALDLLSERYAKGEIQREEFLKMKEEILSALSTRNQIQKNKSQKAFTMSAQPKGT